MVKIIFNDICLAVEAYLPLAVFSGILGLILVILFYTGYILLTHRKINGILPGKVIVIYIFYLYLFMIVSITLLSRPPGSRILVSLMPFSTFARDVYGNAFVVENVLLFTPFGFILPLLGKHFRTVKPCLAAGGIFSLLIEIIQFLTQRGYFQTDDILMNLIGTGIGFGLINFIIKPDQDSS